MLKTGIATKQWSEKSTLTAFAKTSCSGCRLNSVCVPVALESKDRPALDAVIFRARLLGKNAHVYRERDAANAIYVVHSGTLKGYTTAKDGSEQVTRFFFPGEIAGLDGFSTNHYSSSVVALETSSVCRVSFSSLWSLFGALPGLQRYLFRVLSAEIGRDQEHIARLSKYSAERRIASFLLEVSKKHQAQNHSSRTFWLPITRSDFANYLGLTIETTSRIFSRFQREGILVVKGKEVSLLDIEGLSHIADALQAESI